jgi:hypothetical protein
VDSFDAYWLHRYGKISSRKRFQTMEQVEAKPAYIIEKFEPKSDWRPFKLINEKRGIACTVLEEMRWADIARDLLQDGTDSSALAAMVRGKRKSINGWRCEHL